MAEIHAVTPRFEAEIAVGNLLGIPPSSIRLGAVVAVDDEGRMHAAGAALAGAAAKRRIVRLLDDTADALWEQAR